MSDLLERTETGEIEGPATSEARRNLWKARGRAMLRPQFLILATVVLVIAYLALVPLGYLVWGTAFRDGVLSWDNFRLAYTTRGLGELSYNTLVYAFGATGLSVSIGVVLAFFTERTDIPLRRMVFIGSLVPLIIPGLLYTIAWIFLASPRTGILNAWLEPLFGPQFFNVFSMTGLIVVQGLDNAPLAFLLMVAAFRSMDPSLEESAVVSGGSLIDVFRRITIPMTKPAILAAIMILGVRNIESFETPALLGIPANLLVFTSRIWQVLQRFPPDYGQAGAYSVSLLLIVSFGIWTYSRYQSRSKQFQTVTGKGFRPRAIPLGTWRRPIGVIVMVYFFIAIVLPVLVLIYTSTQTFYAVPTLERIGNATLDNYAFIFENRQTARALRNSIFLGLTAATGVMFLSALGSWMVVRSRLPGRWLVDNLAFLPLVIPGLVLGVALIFVYLRFPLPVYGTMWILFIAYLTRFLPYGMRYSSASMYQIGGELEESAQVSGATWWKVFYRINVPLLMPGLIAGWSYVFMVSVRELGSSILLYSPGTEVLSIMIWEQYENGNFVQLSALGVVMIALMTVIVFVAQRLGAKVGVQASGS
ncbi:MAG: ABC transporter permease subunit [Nitriliruptorales bacterium]|nr:ABC transporter permease subunit [Nitriliruptorales bacterium]